MADFDYSTLSPEQSTTALKVFKAAEKHGINPEFAVALAMAESGMVHGPSRRVDEKTKAPISYGVMQLTPALAAQYGIKDYQKASEDENIDVGMRYLKDLTKNPNIGDDPRKTVAGYNAGPGSAYVKSGKEKDLLPETKAHIENIGAFSPQGSLVSPLATDANKDFFGTGKPQEPNDEQKQAFKDLTGEEWTPPKPPKAPEPTAFNPLPGMGGGALVGLALSGAANATGGVADLVKSIKNQQTVTPTNDALLSSEPGHQGGIGTTNYGKAYQGTNLFLRPGGLMDREILTGADPADIQATMKANKVLGAKIESIAPSAVMDPRTGLVYPNSVPWVDPSTGETHNVPSTSTKNPVTGKTVTGPDPIAIAAINKQAQVRQASLDKQAKAQQDAAIENERVIKNQATLDKSNAFNKSIPGRLVNTGLNAARGSLTGLGAYYGAQSASEAANQGNFGQAALHGVSGLSSAADLAASLAPTAAKTAVRGVTGPLAVVADTGANLLKHYPDPKEMALDVGTAGLAFVPGVGVPMALGAGYLRAHPEVLSSNVGNTAGATPGTDPMGGVYYETPDIPRTGPSTTPKSDALQQWLFNRKTKQSPNLNPPADANLIPLGGMYSPGGMY